MKVVEQIQRCMLKDYSLVGAIATDEKEFVLMIRCVLMFRKIAELWQ
jgi:hypothetical protein